MRCAQGRSHRGRHTCAQVEASAAVDGAALLCTSRLLRALLHHESVVRVSAADLLVDVGGLRVGV